MLHGTHSLKSSGPRGSFLLGNLTQFGQDPLGFLEFCAREHGDFVALRFINRPVYILNSPEHIDFVLASHSRIFRKTLGYRTPFMRRLFGQGLLTSEGEFWMRQRKLAQPAFHRDRIASHAEVIVAFTRRMTASWRGGETRDIHLDMMRLTTEVVTKTLFNSAVPKEINELGEASAVVMERFTKQWQWYRILFNLLPESITQPRYEQVMRRLDAFIYGLIAEHRASGRDEGDLLSMLLRARGEDGSQMTDQQLRDELTTLMVAGLDTTALALSWACYLLSQNPDVQKKLENEIDATLGNRAANIADLPRLPYTEMVIKETMRLYPSAWIIGREAIQDFELAGHAIKAGSSMLLSQWLKHRDERYFKSAEKFVPERWGSEETNTLPKFAYFPFGGGPRVCVGSSFAMMEAILALATITQQFRLTAQPNYVIKPFAAITLQPLGGVNLKVEKRERA
ncbi:cytochrome P450 [Pedosphaera parvula]|uniref:Cytochrome P450 n=1 Tax=Pedosphaera parvula (strain Ellin514) TaxID=320771 RepID=B9XNM0_PEDPL|nr:cytochrome P450 [Pedosphaera parvula]EEF58560.1 cytochrome P450 [Pedosphaera parvula Ellin514]